MSDRATSRFLFDRPEIVEAIFEDVPDAIVLADKQREIVLINPSLQRIFGYEADELIGKSTVTLYESEAEFERQGRLRFNLLAEGKLAVYVVNYRRKDGAVFPGETVGAVIDSAFRQ